MTAPRIIPLSSPSNVKAAHDAIDSRARERGWEVELRQGQRSERSHNHEFGWLRDAHASLPEQYAMEPWAQTPEHLRKYALIRTGYCTTDTVAVGSNAAALRVAAFVRGREEYTLTSVQGATVHTFTPESQSRKAMGKERFQASKTAIMEFIANLLGCTVEELARARSA